MLKLVFINVVIILAAVLIYAATKPDTFHVERSISIKAAPEKIFPLINDFHLWNEWTPYNKDPAMKKMLGLLKTPAYLVRTLQCQPSDKA